MNVLSTILYKLGDAAAACENTTPDYDKAIMDELIQLQEHGDTLSDDLHSLKEAVGYLYKRIQNIECQQPQQSAKIIKMK